MSETTRVRQRGIALSDRQCEVLELIERGYTNYEIAQALGVTLEGAKYHVREVMTKLGADSREEAVRFWREEQRSRWSVRGLLALAWPRLAIGAGGAVLVVAAAFLALALFGQDDDETAEQVLVAYSTLAGSDQPALSVLDGTGKELFRVDGSYAGPRFSPDGTRLAAINLDDREGRARIDIFDTSDWSSTRYVPPEDQFSMSWAPDSTLLAVMLSGGVVLVDRRGQEVGSTGQVAETSLGSGIDEPNWAPDSEKLVALLHERLFVVSRTTEVRELRDPGGNGRQVLVPMEWRSPEALFVLDIAAERDPDRFVFLVTFRDGEDPEWTPATLDFTPSPEMQAFQAELEAKFPGLRVRSPVPTADRERLKALLSDEASVPANELPELRLAVNPSEIVVVALGPGQPASAERNVDAVVIR
jgi:DNA-binding CsgD family transcriptional regulator